MKRAWIAPGVLVAAMAGAAPALAAEDASPDEGEHGVEEQPLYDMTADTEEYGLGEPEEWGYDAAEFSAFETDAVVQDEYGYYDGDFDWNTDDEGWDDWYEADTGWWGEDDTDGFWDGWGP